MSEQPQHLPPIGSGERDTLEAEALQLAERNLHRRENIEIALQDTERQLAKRMGAIAANALTRHVEQCWITRIVR